jgi:hypothetical protein
VIDETDLEQLLSLSITTQSRELKRRLEGWPSFLLLVQVFSQAKHAASNTGPSTQTRR